MFFIVGIARDPDRNLRILYMCPDTESTPTNGMVHIVGHSGAYSNHSGGAYNSGASGGQPPQQGNFGYDAQGHRGHYPSDVAATNTMLRGPLDDVWPSPNQHAVSPGQQARPNNDCASLQVCRTRLAKELIVSS